VARLSVVLAIAALAGVALRLGSGSVDRAPRFRAASPALQRRVARLYRNVCAARNRPAGRPPAVVWLTARDHSRRAQRILTEHRSIIDARVQAWQSLGLLPAGFDLAALRRPDFAPDSAFYDFETGRVVLVDSGREVSDETLCHELCHASQCATDGADATLRQLRSNYDAELAFRSILEGEAVAVGGGPVEAIADWWGLRQPYLRKMDRFPYVAGTAFWTRTAAADGSRSILRHPPLSTEQLLRPHVPFSRDPPFWLESAPFSSGGSGWRCTTSNVIGAVRVRLLLAERGTFRPETASDGWDGDRYWFLVDGSGRRAIVWVSLWETAEHATRFAQAYSEAMTSPWDGERPAVCATGLRVVVSDGFAPADRVFVDRGLAELRAHPLRSVRDVARLGR